MGYEIDFLAVGNGSKSGDAIALRFGNLHGTRNEQTVVLIDGGFQDCSDKIVNHVRKHYQTNSIDLVVSTHADADHINGLTGVIQTLEVRELWMHQPSVRRAALERAIRSLGTHPYADQLRSSLESATELERLARQKGIPIREPFTGVTHWTGAFSVLGPTEDFYNAVLRSAATSLEEGGTLWRYIIDATLEVVAKAAETFGVETLTDDGQTSPNNNTSAVTLLNVDNKLSLFTADAGIQALTLAATVLESVGYNPSMLNFIQVPHHGSRRNVGPSVLNRLIGPKRATDEEVRIAFVSAAPDGQPKHPSRRVTNAFRRRGSPVHATQGMDKRHSYQAPDRGWSASVALPFYSEVED